MAKLVNKTEARKASPKDIIEAQTTLANILAEKAENSLDYDEDQVFSYVLSRPIYLNPDDINTVYPVGDNMIAIPSVLPKKNADGSYKAGKYVHAWIQVPGLDAYPTWDANSPTFRNSRTTNYKGTRSVTLHSVIEGMVVSFHHMRQEAGGSKDRVHIDGIRLFYDEDGNLSMEKVKDESDLLFKMGGDAQDFGDLF